MNVLSFVTSAFSLRHLLTQNEAEIRQENRKKSNGVITYEYEPIASFLHILTARIILVILI